MLSAFLTEAKQLKPMAIGADLTDALWIDLSSPSDAEAGAVRELGIDVPTLADMEEIEISNRLYHEDGADYMTAVIPGASLSKTPVMGPVSFILTDRQLITVRYHSPRPFETYPGRANKASAGCSTAERIFLGLVEECISRLADLLEEAGRALDAVTASVFTDATSRDADALQRALEQTGRQGDLLHRVRLGLLTLQRVMSFYGLTLTDTGSGKDLTRILKSLMRDLEALEVHADFLSSRVSLAVDATLGMISLAQNATASIFSVVAVLFMPPTLIASIYGMNFANIPELQNPWGYAIALVAMAVSSLGAFFIFKWLRWF